MANKEKNNSSFSQQKCDYDVLNNPEVLNRLSVTLPRPPRNSDSPVRPIHQEGGNPEIINRLRSKHNQSGTLPLPDKYKLHSPGGDAAANIVASQSLHGLSASAMASAVIDGNDPIEDDKSRNSELNPAKKTMQTRVNRLSSETSTEETRDTRILPAANSFEKIVFCIDISSEMTSKSFVSKTGDKDMLVSLVRKALKMFTRTKSQLNSKHEYAVMLLGENASWMIENSFSADPKLLLAKFDSFSQFAEYPVCHLSSIFEKILQSVPLPVESTVDGVVVSTAAFTVRVILIYGRSHCIPLLSPSPAQQRLQASAYFFIDVLYLHEPVSGDNQCEEIFEVLCNFDKNGTSYILEAAKNPTKVYDSFAQFIGHPLQRTLQYQVNFGLE